MNLKKKSPLISWILLAVLFLYLGKLYFFPNEKEHAQAIVASLASIASFNVPPNPLQAINKITNIKEILSPELEIDLSEYMGEEANQEKSSYTTKDLQSLAPLYFQYIKNIHILTKKFTELEKRTYSFIVIARGKSIKDDFDDAYFAEITFDKKWKLTKIKVLAPPKEN